MRSRPIMILCVLSTLLGATSLWGAAARSVLAQSELFIHPGETTSGEISSRLGQEWGFQGCADEVVSFTATSEDFVPFLAITDAGGDLLVEEEGDEEALTAEIVDFALPDNGSFILLVAGSTIRDRGLYELTMTSSSGAEAAETGIPLITLGESVAGEVTNRFGSEFLFVGCEGAAVSFTLESEAFTPHLELFGPDGRDPLLTNTASRAGEAAQIANFTLPEAGLYTLVASGESVRDRGEFVLSAGAPEAEIATATPTPTRTPTATPTPLPTFTPTPAPQASALDPTGIVIQVNGGDGDMLGEIFLNPNNMVSAFEESDTIVVSDRFYLELFVLDPQAGFYYGAGIDRVEFVFDCPNGEQYVRVERTPRYCSFSDEGGACYTLRLQTGDYFPGSQCEIVNDYYSVNITAYPTNRDRQPGNWNFYIRPEIP